MNGRPFSPAALRSNSILFFHARLGEAWSCRSSRGERRRQGELEEDSAGWTRWERQISRKRMFRTLACARKTGRATYTTAESGQRSATRNQ